MSSPRYCEDPEPHDGHEWYRPVEDLSLPWGDYFYCWGVKSDDLLGFQIEEVARRKEALADAEANLREHSIDLRRTEAEFYGGDGTKCVVCLDQGLIPVCDECKREPGEARP